MRIKIILKSGAEFIFACKSLNVEGETARWEHEPGVYPQLQWVNLDDVVAIVRMSV